MSVFVFAFIGSFLFYLFSQKDVYADWQRRLFLFPLFMAGSMGFAVNNSRAVLEGLFKKKSEFVRTPEVQHHVSRKDSWSGKQVRPGEDQPDRGDRNCSWPCTACSELFPRYIFSKLPQFRSSSSFSSASRSSRSCPSSMRTWADGSTRGSDYFDGGNRPWRSSLSRR